MKNSTVPLVHRCRQPVTAVSESPVGGRMARHHVVTSLVHLPAVVISSRPLKASTIGRALAVPRRYTVLPCIRRGVYAPRNPILTNPVLSVDQANARRVSRLLCICTAGLVPPVSWRPVHSRIPVDWNAIGLWLPRPVRVALGLHKVVGSCCLPSVCNWRRLPSITPAPRPLVLPSTPLLSDMAPAED